MLVAYLRGLLKPDYPNGIRSIIRENFILQALARELDAKELMARLRHEESYVALLNHESANKLLKHQDKMLSLAFENFRHKVERQTKHGLDLGAIDQFIKTYHDLKKQGLIGVKQADTENLDNGNL